MGQCGEDVTVRRESPTEPADADANVDQLPDLSFGVGPRAAEDGDIEILERRFDLVERPRVAGHDPSEQRGEERWRVEKPELALAVGQGPEIVDHRNVAGVCGNDPVLADEAVDDDPLTGRVAFVGGDGDRRDANVLRGLLDLCAGVIVADAKPIRVRQFEGLANGVLLVLGRVEQVDPQDLLLAQVTCRVGPLARSPCRGACRTGMRSASLGVRSCENEHR